MAFIPYCSLPELEACMEVWGFMEMIHGRSYTYIIKNIYPDPSNIFDHIITDDRILERAKVSLSHMTTSSTVVNNGVMVICGRKTSVIHLHPNGKSKMSNVNCSERSPTLTFLKVLGSTLVLLVVSPSVNLKLMEGSVRSSLYRQRREPTPSNHSEHPEQVEIG